MTKTDIKDALKNSNYWTWFTEWLLGFGGKAAWPILIICTLYMGAELYPGVNLPGPLNFAVFLAQLFALDMGGMGLVSIARQVKDAGHEKEAKEADSFGKVLVAIVITSLVTVGVKQFLSGIPALTTPATKGGSDSIMGTYIEPIIMCVEFILVIARVVCAVLYGKVMHALKQTDHTPPPPATPAVDVAEMIRQAVEGLQAQFTQSLQAITTEQARMLAAIQQVQIAPAVVPQVDSQAIIAEVVAQFETRFTSAMKRLESDVKQNVLVSLASETAQVKQQNGTALNGPRLVSLPQRSVPSGRAKQPTTDEHKAVSTGQSESTDSADCKSAVYALLDLDNTRQPADLARETGFPRTTVWRHWNRYHEEHGTRGLAGIVAGESESVAQVETA